MKHDKMLELVAALRSGKYKQGRNQLRYGDKFCCLGVACDISGLSEWTKGDSYKYLGDDAVLPKRVQDYFGFKCNRGWISSLGRTLTHLNDVSPMSFTEIC